MSAADSTSKGQFGWIEDTEVNHTPAFNEFSPTTTIGHSSVTRVALGDEAMHYPSGSVEAPQEARITANWASVSPHLFSGDDIAAGRDFPRPPGELSPRAGGSYDDDTPRQGLLFSPGHEAPPKVDFMESTSRSRFATMGGLGALANIVHERTGRMPLASSDLSEHSAPLVSRITGKETAVSNTMDFVEPEDRETVTLPWREVHNKHSDDSAWAHPVGRSTSTTDRMVPDSEIAAGKSMLVAHMRAMRAPKPDTTEKMFPDPGGPSLEEHQANTDKAGRVEAVLRRHRAAQQEPL